MRDGYPRPMTGLVAIDYDTNNTILKYSGSGFQ